MMTKIIETKTPRLLLRQWQESDCPLFAQLNASAKVMKFFPGILDHKQSDEFAHTLQQRIADNGWGFWAVEIPDVCEFIGFVGLNKPVYELPFAPVIEVGWRLSDHYWGNGYATEAAQTALNIGFNQLGFSEIVSFTSVLNKASIKVMERLSMHNTNQYFEHPKVPENHTLRKHCLYKLSQQDWLKLK